MPRAEAEPVFSRPAPDAEYMGDTDAGTTDTGRKIIVNSVRRPLALQYEFREIRTADGRQLYTAPAQTADGKTTPAPLARGNWTLYAETAATVLTALLVFLLFHNLKQRRMKADSFRTGVLLALLAVSVRWTLMLHILTFSGGFICSPADEPGYLHAASCLLNGDFATPYSFTIGLGLWYMPFVKICNAADYYGFAVPFSLFNALLTAPACLAVGFAILRNLGFRNTEAFAAVMLWAVLPFFTFHAENWNNCSFPGFFAPPPPNGDTWRLYTLFIQSGFNAMSDYPAALVLLLSILTICKIKVNEAGFLLSGALFGAGCLIRMPLILYVPFLGAVTALKFRDNRLSAGRAAALLGYGAAGFLTVFGWQLILNAVQFGNPLTFGYINHQCHNGLSPADGFTLKTLFQGAHIRYLGEANRGIWAAGAAGLLLMRERRQAALLCLWIIPPILFFYGYSHTFCDAYRFILPTYLPLAAAYCSRNLWGSGRHRTAAAVIFTAALLTVTGSAEIPPLLIRELAAYPLRGIAVFFTAAVTAAAVLQKDPRGAAAFICFGMIFFTSGGMAAAALFTVLLCVSTFALITEIAKKE